MEGPSLFLAAEQLAPFINQTIDQVFGNTTIQKERLVNQKILAIFSYGKYLIIQFHSFALVIHFLLFGSFKASIQGKSITGDYTKKDRVPRLKLDCLIGDIELFSCSVRFLEEINLYQQCDFTIDTISPLWDSNKALSKMKKHENEEIADVLLDQTIFMGAGNIIKNEVLLQAKLLPTKKVKNISVKKRKELIRLLRQYVFQFYEWRKNFELKKHYNIYRQSLCKLCGNKVKKKKTGKRNRISFICEHCES